MFTSRWHDFLNDYKIFPMIVHNIHIKNSIAILVAIDKFISKQSHIHF